MNNIQAVAKEHFFNYVENFMDYRKTIYEASDQTIKSNRIDIKLFKDFLDMKDYQYIDGHAVMDFQSRCGGISNSSDSTAARP